MQRKVNLLTQPKKKKKTCWKTVEKTSGKKGEAWTQEMHRKQRKSGWEKKTRRTGEKERVKEKK